MDDAIHPYLIENEPYYRAAGNEVGLLARPADDAQGPYWLRQDALRRTHGLAAEAAADHHGLQRGHDRVRPGGPLPARCPGHRVARRAADRGRALRCAICYLDEVVEARQDTMVVIHPLTDERRMLPLDKRGELVHAHPDFRLVVSYNPGYQSAAKDMKPSTRQRFGAIDFDFPPAEVEVVAHESGIERAVAARLVTIAQQSRALRGRGLDEGMSTRMLVDSDADRWRTLGRRCFRGRLSGRGRAPRCGKRGVTRHPHFLSDARSPRRRLRAPHFRCAQLPDRGPCRQLRRSCRQALVRLVAH